MSDRLENLYKMLDKYRDLGNDVAADRVQSRIDELERPVCKHCYQSPCQCDALHDQARDDQYFNEG